MKALQQLIERNLYRFLLPVARLYWFVCRPRTRGAKCLIVADGKVLLIQNTYHLNKYWNLPGGRVGSSESPDAAVRREVLEETGVSLGACSKLGEWLARAEYKRDTIHFYLAEFPVQPHITIDPVEIATAEWFPLDAIPEHSFFSVKKALEMYTGRKL